MLRFALSQNGTQIARTQAMMALINSGRYTGPKIVKLWDDDREEWRDVTLNTQRIGSIDFKAGPKTLNLIEKANKAKKPQDAIVLLKKAIEIEPGCATAVYNLGVALIESGEIEEGEAQIFRSVQVNPNYTFGHAAIGLTEAEAGNEQEANEHLEVVARAEVISPSTAVMANLAWCLLALRRRDLQNARLHLEIAARIEPDHHLVDKYQKQIEEAEKIRENFGFLFEFQRESAQRSHTKLLKSRLSAEMSLLDCLEMHTKDMLTGTAHFLELSSVGKKADVAARLAEAILDEEFLRDILDEFLQENVREALNWIIEANGVRPWNELIGKYGDDFEESVHWDYHDPESITGQLRMSGLLYSGTLDGQKTAFIPAELCALLQKVTQ
jgi:tetratricopeptide (TPR) repeat protein